MADPGCYNNGPIDIFQGPEDFTNRGWTTVPNGFIQQAEYYGNYFKAIILANAFQDGN